ncbi:lysis protein [Arsenophonus nasoniae]|uniref:Lysis protein n=1 Tax=Arsenophonus nasoniae TaxID=638 RepID=A0AA95GSJ9_9GAMM|nr:lysis protein [Arsenophonus nasoniae]WGM04017.1 lysis protein [Arsenophonus nasoniae]
MFWRPVTLILISILVLMISLSFVLSRYRTLRTQYHTLQQRYHAQIALMETQQQKIDALHQLDIQHTEELNNANAELDKLHDAVRAGNKRLRVNAVCRASKTTTPKSRYDEATPQLGEAARQDYFRLRAMIVENEKQTEYLQKYIKTQCLGR